MEHNTYRGSYKVCEHYHNLTKEYNTFRSNTQRTQPLSTNICTNNINIVLTHNNTEATQRKPKVTQIRSKTQPSY